MSEVLQALAQAAQSLSIWEALAVVFGLAYLILATREDIRCWYAAFIGTGISIFLFFDVDLVMESALNVYYLVMAVYGWYQWRHGGESRDDLPISTWRPRVHVIVIALVLCVSAGSGYFLSAFTAAAWPYLDSFTSWAAVLTTFMVARKILENWIYWLVIDALSVFLYIDRGLYLYALLFVLYIGIAVYGFFEWLRHLREQQASAAGQTA